MIHDKILRFIWMILFVSAFIGVVVSKNVLLALGFGLISGVIFIVDFMKFNRYYKEAGARLRTKKGWHIFSNLTQWLFWTGVLYVPFSLRYSTGYKIFVLADLFLISTFAFYKFTKCK